MHRLTGRPTDSQLNVTAELALTWDASARPKGRKPLAEELNGFCEFGQPTRTLTSPFADASGKTREVPTYVKLGTVFQ